MVSWGLLSHYIDDFIFLGLPNSTHCQDLFDIFGEITFTFGVPTTLEKPALPNVDVEYLLLVD